MDPDRTPRSVDYDLGLFANVPFTGARQTMELTNGRDAKLKLINGRDAKLKLMDLLQS